MRVDEEGVSRVLGMFNFLIWVVVTKVISLWKFLKLYTWNLCTFGQVYYSISKKKKKSLLEAKERK